MLKGLSRQFNEPDWKKCAALFYQSASEIEILTNIIVDILLKKGTDLNAAKSSLNKIADIEEQAFRILLNVNK
jgi:hypothetical protein